MAFSAMELEIIDDTIGALCRRMSPPRLAGKLRFVCEIDGHSASIIEERPPWEGSGEWTRMPCARFRYIHAQATWTLYWMRRDHKWHVYDPETKKRDLPTLVRVVEEDKYGAFFGQVVTEQAHPDGRALRAADAPSVGRQVTVMRNLTQKVAEYYAGARHRAKRRKSAWNALLIPFCFGGWFGIWYGLFRLVWLFHVTIYPEHQLRDFWQAGISFRSYVPSCLMVFSLMPGAIVAGFMLGNILLWLITPVRRIFEAEAHGYPGTSFRDSMRGLFRFGIWLLPIGLVIAFTTAYCLKSLR